MDKNSLEAIAQVAGAVSVMLLCGNITSYYTVSSNLKKLFGYDRYSARTIVNNVLDKIEKENRIVQILKCRTGSKIAYEKFLQRTVKSIS